MRISDWSSDVCSSDLLTRWHGAIADVAGGVDGPVTVASLRGGALIDDGAKAEAWWRLAPAGGASLLRTLLRARVAADREAGIVSSCDGLLAEAASAPLLLAGNLLSPAMIAERGAAAAHDWKSPRSNSSH